jgi:hypothetical protein
MVPVPELKGLMKQNTSVLFLSRRTKMTEGCELYNDSPLTLFRDKKGSPDRGPDAALAEAAHLEALYVWSKFDHNDNQSTCMSEKGSQFLLEDLKELWKPENKAFREKVFAVFQPRPGRQQLEADITIPKIRVEGDHLVFPDTKPAKPK